MINTILENPLSSATILNKICLEIFGPEYYNWEPETAKDELFLITESIPEINLDKIQAISVLLSTEQFYTYFEAFENICNVFNCEDPRFDAITPLNSLDMSWAILEAKLNDEDSFDNNRVFSPEVENYIIEIYKKDGSARIPPFITGQVNIVKTYNIMPDLNKEQVRYQIDFELDINEYIKNRVKGIKSELSLYGKNK